MSGFFNTTQIQSNYVFSRIYYTHVVSNPSKFKINGLR